MSNDLTDQNKKLVDAFVQALFTDGDLDAVDRHLAPDFVHHDPPFSGAPGGREDVRRMAAMFRAALPDWHSDLDLLVAEDDLVAERFTACFRDQAVRKPQSTAAAAIRAGLAGRWRRS